MSIKYSNDIIGNRTRDLPVCSAVLQATAPPRTPFKIISYDKIFVQLEFHKKKGKVIPLQARCGPDGGYRNSSTLP